MRKLRRSFFERDPLICASELIGCELEWDGCAGIVVETEAYSTIDDEACHTFMRPSAREFVARHDAGAAYVYLNYGMHWLLNALVKNGTEDGFVLLRALEPTRGLDEMKKRRGLENLTRLCSGPGKLTQALAVTGADHGLDFCTHATRGFSERRAAVKVADDVRIGISRAMHLRWRFVLGESPHLSAPVKAQAN